MPPTPKGILVDETGIRRCEWAGQTPDYCAYHDNEWGMPTTDDPPLFEKVCLEGFQAGLSWLTILRKREHFRRAFKAFDVGAVARFNRRSVDRLLGNAGIVRHRGKIESTINNARRALEVIEERGSLAAYFWDFEPHTSARPRRINQAALRRLNTSAASTALSKDLKQRGWTFVGPITMYAFMQAMGLVNDHLEGCDARNRVARARVRTPPPRAGL
ncbi:MAG: DNA-3-methyladenine glycosylase I [Nannocystaceae bacterium]